MSNLFIFVIKKVVSSEAKGTFIMIFTPESVSSERHKVECLYFIKCCILRLLKWAVSQQLAIIGQKDLELIFFYNILGELFDVFGN